MAKKITFFLLAILITASFLFLFSSQNASAFSCSEENRCEIKNDICVCPTVPVWLTEDTSLLVIASGAVHSVELFDVTEDQESCGIVVDDKLEWVDEGQKKTVNGVKLVVFDVRTVHTLLKDRDICRVFVAGTILLPLKEIKDVLELNENITIEIKEDLTIVLNETADIPEEMIEEEMAVQEEPVKKTICQKIFDFFKNLFS